MESRLHPRRLWTSSRRNKRLTNKFCLLTGLWIFHFGRQQQKLIIFFNISCIDSNEGNKECFKLISKNLHLVTRKIMTRKPRLALKYLIFLFFMFFSSKFLSYKIFFSQVTIFATQIVMWGNWVCGSPLFPSDGFSAFSAYPHNHHQCCCCTLSSLLNFVQIVKNAFRPE